MAGKKQKLKPDTVLKNYWGNNDQFADFFNAVLFGGRPVIRPEELEDVDTEESTVLEHRDYAESMQASRDGIKVRKKSSAHGVELVLLGMEQQEHVHYAMPLRVMGYDYAAYKKQYDSMAAEYRKAGADGMEGDEYLSGMKKTDRFIPVVTAVVYYGEQPWDGAESLHEMLGIPEEMAPYVNDYKMILVEARKNSLVLHNTNNRDLFTLLGLLLDRTEPVRETRRKAIDYAREHGVDKSVIMTVAGAANCRIDYGELDGKEDVDMCTVFEETRNEGLREGRQEGRNEGRAEEIVETGHEFGLSENEILERLQKKLNMSRQKAEECLERFGKQQA